MALMAVIILGLSLSQNEVSSFPRHTDRPINSRSLLSQEVGTVVFTEHGFKEYLGDGVWRYRSSVGETNTWNGSHYVKYVYDPDNKQVSIGKLTFTHGPNGVISVSHSETGSMIGALRWYAQYYLNDLWNNFTFDNYEYLGATQTEENASVFQRWYSTNGELNVSYTYSNWNELKMRAKATNLAAQSVPVRVLWALTDIRINPEYTLIYNDGVAVGVELGNEQAIYWHDVTETAPEININPILDKDNRRAAVVFGNMSSILAQGETLDIDPTYTVSSDSDDAYADCDGGFNLIPTSNTISVAYPTGGPVEYEGYIRLTIDIDEDVTITESDFNLYEITDSVSSQEREIFRMAGTDATTAPESLSSRPTRDTTYSDTYDTNGVNNEWVQFNTTDIIQDQVDESGWGSGNRMLFIIVSEYGASSTTGYEDFQYPSGTHRAYVDISYIYPQEGEFDYVDMITDLHDPTDIGTHSAFVEMKDKDGAYDTLTETDQFESEWQYIDSYSDVSWSEYGSPPYLDVYDDANYIGTGSNGAQTGYCGFANTSISVSSYAVNLSVYWRAVYGDSYIEWEIDWNNDDSADASGSFSTHTSSQWDNTGTISGLDTQTEIDNARLRLTHNKGGGGPEPVEAHAARLGIADAETNYDLDLEVGWTNANYTQNNEYLCIFGGSQGAEDLRVDVWNDTASSWINVITDLAAGWNNVSVSDHLVDSTFEIRFTDTSDDATLADTWQVEGVLLRTYSAAGGEYTETIYESLPLADSGTESMDASQTVYDLIQVQESSIAAASLSLVVSELIELYDSVSIGAGFGIVVSELIELYDSVANSISAVVVIMEQIAFVETVSVSSNFFLTILEVIGLAATTIATKGGGVSITIFETVGLGDSVSTALSGSVTLFETIGISDVTQAIRGLSVTIFETIELASSTATSQLTHYYVYEVIGIIESVGVTGGVIPTIDTGSVFYQVFLSLEIWGYIGPAALVIGGFIAMNEDQRVGVLWFVVECLVILQYIALLDATPDYVWHVYILVFGSLLTAIYPLWGKRR